MTKEREALKLALEALKHGGCPPDCKDGMTDSGGVHPWGEAALIPCPNCQTIAAIKEALEQPEQEPVAEVVGISMLGVSSPKGKHINALVDLPIGAKLYTAPPQRTWVGLTDEQKQMIHNKTGASHALICLIQNCISEVAHGKEKNT